MTALPDQQLLAYADAGATAIVGAVQLKRGRVIHTGGAMNQHKHGYVGDWVVMQSNGDYYFMNNEAFTANFTRHSASDTLSYILNGYATMNIT